MINSLAIDPTLTQTAYAATNKGLFKSTNGGDSWSAVNAGLGNLDVYALAMSPTAPHRLYAGAEQARVTLRLMTADGSAIAQFPFTIDPGARISRYLSDFWPAAATLEGRAEVSSNVSVVAVAVVVQGPPIQLATIPVVPLP